MTKFADANYPDKQKVVLLRLVYPSGEAVSMSTLWNNELEFQYETQVKNGQLVSYQILEEKII